MRLIDADALLEEMIGITDGWLKPPKNWKWYEDCVRNAPTIDPVQRVTVEKRWELRDWDTCSYCGNHLISKWRWCPYCGRGIDWDGYKRENNVRD